MKFLDITAAPANTWRMQFDVPRPRLSDLTTDDLYVVVRPVAMLLTVLNRDDLEVRALTLEELDDRGKQAFDLARHGNVPTDYRLFSSKEEAHETAERYLRGLISRAAAWEARHGDGSDNSRYWSDHATCFKIVHGHDGMVELNHDDEKCRLIDIVDQMLPPLTGHTESATELAGQLEVGQAYGAALVLHGDLKREPEIQPDELEIPTD